MKSKTLLVIILSLLFVIVNVPITAEAQTGEIREEFDDPALPGWEHSEGVTVEEGILQINPGNFVIRFGESDPDSYAFEFRTSGPAVIFFRYAIADGQEYVLIIHPDGVELEKSAAAPPEFLGGSPWESVRDEWVQVTIETNLSGQVISLDGEMILSTEEDTILHGPGIGFWVEGETTADLDNIVLSGSDDGIVESSQETETIGSEAEADVVPAPAENGGGDERMKIDDLITELTSSQANPTQLSTFIINLLLAVVLSYVLSRVYIHWGSSLSNRRRFAANFILITVTTTFIILVVRSSVALSLGLVGALSIVRFRSAIKEPEELAYLFFAIAIGIGLGDNQRLITVIALAAAILVLGLMRLFRGRRADFNLHVSLAGSTTDGVDLDSIVQTLGANSSQMKLIRFDDSGKELEVSFLAEFKNMDQLKAAKAALRDLSDTLEISFLDNKGVW